jgi:MFS family permease
MILGGVLTEYLSWRWCLYVNVAFAAAALAAAVPLITNQPRNPGARLDVPGSLLAPAASSPSRHCCSRTARAVIKASGQRKC